MHIEIKMKFNNAGKLIYRNDQFRSEMKKKIITNE